MHGDRRPISNIMAIVLVMILLTTAYLAAGALHDRLVTEEEDPVAQVSLVDIETEGIGGTIEHPPLPGTLTTIGEYDVGVKVVGLRSEGGVITKISFTRTGISLGDLDVYYLDTVSNNWRYLEMQDDGNVLVGTLDLPGGVAIYEGYESIYRLIVISNIDGNCLTKAWVEVV